MTSTKMDKSKIDFAGVDSGLKIFSRPVEEDWATAVAEQIKNETDRKAALITEFFACRISAPRIYPKILRSDVGVQPCFHYAGSPRQIHHKIEGILHDPFVVFVRMAFLSKVQLGLHIHWECVRPATSWIADSATRYVRANW